MLKWINKKRNKKGFTLVELVVVIAILGIVAAIAVPKFSSIRDEATIKADAATATQIVSAARIQETNEGTHLDSIDKLLPAYMDKDVKSQSGKSAFVLEGGEKGAAYTVSWTVVGGTLDGKKCTVTEGQAFDIKNHVK